MSNHSKLSLYKLLIFFLAVLTLAIGSCLELRKDENDTQRQQSRHNRYEGSLLSVTDMQFMEYATEINLEQSRSAKLSMRKATFIPTMDLSFQVLAANEQALKELKNLAVSKEFALPLFTSVEGFDSYEMLVALPAKDFDQAYTERVIKMHAESITMYERAIIRIEDTELKAWAMRNLIPLRIHHEQAIRSLQQLKKNPS